MNSIEPPKFEVDGPFKAAPLTGLSIAAPSISLRDYFAAEAMQGYSANPECYSSSYETLAEMAYKQADAMMKAREQS